MAALTCTQCANFSFQHASRDMARLRLGVCSFLPRYTYLSPEASCPKFAQAEKGIVAARIKFINAKGKKCSPPSSSP